MDKAKQSGVKIDAVKWDAFVNEWKTSDESQTAFCLRKAISYNTFIYWKMKRSKHEKIKSLPKITAAFAPVKINKPSSVNLPENIRIICPSGSQIIIPMAIPQTKLENLLKIIGVISC